MRGAVQLAESGGGESHPHKEMVSVLFPIGADAELMQRELSAIAAALTHVRHEILAIYDGASNLAALDTMRDRPASLRLVKGMPGGKDIQAGIRAAAGDVVVTLNEAEPDPYFMIGDMARKVREEGCAVVVAGRREPPRLRRWAVWNAAGMNARDVTTMFRAFDANYLDGQMVESSERCAAGFELTVKAHLQSLHIEELRVPRTAGMKTQRDALRPYMHWLAQLLQAPILVWSVWLLMIGVLLAHALAVGKGQTWGHIDNVAILAAGAFALTLAVRRVRVRTRFADAFFSLVLLNPLLYSPKTHPFDPTLIATGVLALMAGAIVAMKRDHLLRYFAVAGLAIVLTAISENFVMILPALVAWLIGAGYLVARIPGDGEPAVGRRRGFAMMAAGEVGLVIFGLACIMEEPTKTPAPAHLFASIAGFVDFPLLVLAMVMLALGWQKGPHGKVPPHFAGMLALLVGLLTMLLNNFQEGALASPGADQTVLVLCLVYVVFALHGPRRLQWIAPPLLLICAGVYTVFR